MCAKVFEHISLEQPNGLSAETSILGADDNPLELNAAVK